MGKGLIEHYLKKELYELIKTDDTLFDFIKEGSFDGMWYRNLENIEDEWLSPRFWEVLGYDPKEKKHSSLEWQDIIFKEDLKETTKNLEMHLQDPKHPYDQIVRYKHKDGSTVWIRCRGIAIRDDKGKAIRMLGAHTDITDLKQKEASLSESEQRFRVTLQSLDDGVIIHAPDSSIIDFNNRALEILGLSRDQLLGKTANDPMWKFVDEHEKPLRLEEYPINRILANKKPINNLTIGIFQSANEEIIWAQVNGTPIFDHQGQFKEVVISFYDITQLKKSHKRVQESEQRFKVLHNASFGGIAVHDQGLILDCNQGLSDITGFSMEDLIGMNGLLLIAPEYRDFVMNQIVTGYEKPYEVIGIRKNKEIYPLKLEARNIPYEDKQVRVVEFRDITELKQKENLLIESEQKFRKLFEQAPFGYQSLDDEGHFIEVNEKWLEIMGYQKEEVVGKWFGDFLVSDMKEQFKKRFKMFKERGNIHSEFSMQTKNGDIILVGFDGNVSYDENHAFIQTHCTVTDITEISISNKKLMQSEEQYRLLTSKMQLGLALHEIICDDNGKPIDYRFISVNSSFEHLTGLKREDILGKTVLEVLPSVEKYWIEAYGNVALTGKSIQYENYSKELDKYFNTSAYSPKKGQFAVIVEDITERVLIEKQLVKERLDLLTSQKIAKLGTWRLDVKTNEVTWSEELYKMYGFDPTQPVPPYTEHMKLFTKQSWDKLSTALALTITKGIPYEMELEMAIEDKTRGWMWVKGEAEYDDQKEIVSLTGAAQDITKRKQLEHNLMEAHQIAKLGRWELIHNEQRLIWSETIFDIFEIDSKRFESSYEGFLKVIHPEDRSTVDEVFKRSLVNKQGYSIEHRLLMEDGRIKWVTEKCNTEFDEKGQPIRSVGVVQDITELKKQEELKQTIENQWSKLIQEMPLGFNLREMIFDDNEKGIDYKFLSVNDFYENMTGLKKENILGKRAAEVLPNIEDMWINKYAEVVLSGKTVVIEDYSRALGKYFRVVAYPYIENQFVVIAEDITEKKVIEEENIYIANHDYLTNLYNRRYFVNSFNAVISKGNSPHGLMMIDINGLKIINDAYGHVQGDEAIRQVANLLMKVFEQDDVVARIGGDEFAILAPHKNVTQLQDYKDKLVSLSRGIKIENIPVSLAIGYEILNDNDKDIDELLGRAEKQLYRHKITVGESIRNHAIKAILNTLTDKYKEEKIHSAHVSQLCKQIGTELGLSKEEIDILELAGMYHDIGKISIPDAILNKPGKLTDEEFEIIKTHTQIGYQILRAADEYSGLAEYALSHHERWDGKGYPKGLKGKNIPLFSRIINVADSFEAMTADRPYRKGMSIEDAILEIKRCSGSQFDPEIANLFLSKVLKCDSEKT